MSERVYHSPRVREAIDELMRKKDMSYEDCKILLDELGVSERTCRFDWALAENGWADHTCSSCGYTRNTDIHVSLGYKYCPNCGAKVVSE